MSISLCLVFSRGGLGFGLLGGFPCGDFLFQLHKAKGAGCNHNHQHGGDERIVNANHHQCACGLINRTLCGNVTADAEQDAGDEAAHGAAALAHEVCQNTGRAIHAGQANHLVIGAAVHNEQNAVVCQRQTGQTAQHTAEQDAGQVCAGDENNDVTNDTDAGKNTDHLAHTAGFAGELAQKLNETSEQLRRRNEIIARRDTARTEWIAGVSHDIRTPLALILGWAEQLQRDAALPAAARQKAGGICTQCEKIRSLIEDLNLTSKLQYGAQPLRRRSTQAGPFLRRVVAAFCENPLAARCTLDCSITPAVETAILHADAALLTRALENVLQNAVRHNAGPITLAFHADADETTLHLTIQDDGTGYPQSVLAVLNGEPEGENAPHILGLHVVEQIINAHGGSVQFVNRNPHGAKVMMQLPLAKDENEK